MDTHIATHEPTRPLRTHLSVHASLSCAQNLVFGATGGEYWRAQFKRQIRQKFGMQALSDGECAETHDLRAIIASVQYGDLNGLQLLFKRIAYVAYTRCRDTLPR